MTNKAVGRFYEIIDVFTEDALSGNPVAIVHDALGLSDEKMQAIAGEFNLSETVFVLPAINPMHCASLRIFKHDGEMPFAGHPTIGTMIALGQKQQQNSDVLLMLEEKIGVIRGVVDYQLNCPFAEFDLPQLPKPLALDIPKETFASALGLQSHEIGFENHLPTLWTAGVPYFFIPVNNLKSIASAAADPVYIEQNFSTFAEKIPSFYLYCRETQIFQSAFHARMFRTDGSEDAATGSAASAFCGVVQYFDQPLDGTKEIWLEQGMEMGRPSRLHLEWFVEQGMIKSARIGGHGVKVAEGQLFV